MKLTLIALLSVLFVLGSIVQLLSPHVWLNTDRTSLFSFLNSNKEDRFSATSSRTWFVAEIIDQLHLSFDAKRISGDVGWQWFTSSGGFELEPLVEEGKHFTRIKTPQGSDPYLMRTFTLPERTAGQTFRVDIEMRSATPLSAEGCRGVWLQVWYEGGDASCLPVALTPQWQTFTHIWTVPQKAVSSVIRVVLNDFDGLSYDVANVHLYKQEKGVWQESKPLLPTFPSLTASWENNKSETGQILQITEEWSSFYIDIQKKPQDSVLTATLIVPAGVTLATRDIKLSVPAKPLRANIRQSYVFGHPNLAGHTVVMVTLVLLVFTTRLPIQILVAALGFTACYFTGSRSAWLVLMVSIAAILWFKQSIKRKYLLSFYVLALLGLLALWPYLGRLQVTDVDNPSSRQDIWLTSLKIAGDHLGLGIGTSHERFSELWYSYNPNAAENVKHAHNIVLEQLVDFGIFGGFAIVWLLLGLVRLAWLRQGSLGLVISLALIALNMADVSLFYTWVFVPFILYLNSSKKPV